MIGIGEILKEAVSLCASDIFIVSGTAVCFKVFGNVMPRDGETVMPADAEYMIRELFELADIKMDTDGISRELDFSFSFAEGESVRLVLSGPGFAYAPVVQGQDAGFVYVCVGDSVAGKVPCVYAHTVEQVQPPKKSFWKKWFGGGEK